MMPSSSSSELSRPHIGSGGGGGTFFAEMPDSQWPALPTQQAIVLLSEEALEIGTSVAKNDKAQTKHRMLCDTRLYTLWFLMIIYCVSLTFTGFRTSFILHFGQVPRDFEVISSCIGQT